MNGANLSTAAAGRSSRSPSTTPATFAQAPFPFSDRPFKGESRKQLPRELPGSSWAPYGWQHRPRPGPSPRARISAGLQRGQRATGPGQGAEKDEGRRRGSGTRSRRARGGEETCRRPCARPADSQAEPAWGRAGRQLTRPRRTWHHCPSVSSKGDHRLALRFRIVLESGLFLKRSLKVTFKNWGRGEEERARRELGATHAGSRESYR